MQITQQHINTAIGNYNRFLAYHMGIDGLKALNVKFKYSFWDALRELLCR